jgi:hypothetical protein
MQGCVAAAVNLNYVDTKFSKKIRFCDNMPKSPFRPTVITEGCSQNTNTLRFLFEVISEASDFWRAMLRL